MDRSSWTISVSKASSSVLTELFKSSREGAKCRQRFLPGRLWKASWKRCLSPSAGREDRRRKKGPLDQGSLRSKARMLRVSCRVEQPEARKEWWEGRKLGLRPVLGTNLL